MPGKRWAVSTSLVGLLAVFFCIGVSFRGFRNNNEMSLRGSGHRLLQSGTTEEYFILLHLLLENVDDDLASQFGDPTSRAATHLCDSVNEQVSLLFSFTFRMHFDNISITCVSNFFSFFSLRIGRGESSPR